jgi:hypothetical protein
LFTDTQSAHIPHDAMHLSIQVNPFAANPPSTPSTIEVAWVKAFAP